MRLVVDVGNTRMKWAWTCGTEVTGHSIFLTDGVEGAIPKSWSGQEAPAKVLVASVAPEPINRKIVNWMRENWGMEPQFFQSEAQTLRLVNSYADPGQLGCDRWAALLGARSLTSGVLSVVDCGTAITIDALTEKDYFPGGVILPGVSLTQKSLSIGTSGIQEDRTKLGSILGRTTAECISSGSYIGLAGAIDRVLSEIEVQLGMGKTYITGGDAESLLPLIKHSKIIHKPDLVLTGLAYVLESDR